MQPTYTNNFINNTKNIDGIEKEAGSILDRLLKLEWLQVTEARKEYFMSDNPLYYTYGRGCVCGGR